MKPRYIDYLQLHDVCFLIVGGTSIKFEKNVTITSFKGMTAWEGSHGVEFAYKGLDGMFPYAMIKGLIYAPKPAAPVVDIKKR
jgi:hypothetical protein